jgi:hypothetical protein
MLRSGNLRRYGLLGLAGCSGLRIRGPKVGAADKCRGIQCAGLARCCRRFRRRAEGLSAGGGRGRCGGGRRPWYGPRPAATAIFRSTRCLLAGRSCSGSASNRLPPPPLTSGRRKPLGEPARCRTAGRWHSAISGSARPRDRDSKCSPSAEYLLEVIRYRQVWQLANRPEDLSMADSVVPE